MPTYSYRCTECGEAFDIQQAFTDDTLTVCPNCGGTLRKLFNNVGVSFTGSGFYRNDSRAKPPSESASSTSEPSSSESSSPSSAPSTPAAPAKAGKKESTSTTSTSSAKE